MGNDLLSPNAAMLQAAYLEASDDELVEIVEMSSPNELRAAFTNEQLARLIERLEAYRRRKKS